MLTWRAAGAVSIDAAFLVLMGCAIPVAVALMILAAVVTVVVAWLKPDEIERWLDRATHFGNNKIGKFGDLESQAEAAKTFGAA